MTLAPEFEFIPPSSGSWLVGGNYRLVNHEVGHAAIALYFRLPLLEIRIDRPLHGVEGQVAVGFVDVDMDELEPRLLVSMAGALGVGGPPLPHEPADLADYFPTYPPAQDSRHTDERNMWLYSSVLSTTEDRWHDLIGVCKELLLLPDVKEARRNLSFALWEKGALPGDEARAIAGL